MELYYLNCCNCQELFSVNAKRHRQALNNFKSSGVKYYCHNECKMIARKHAPRKEVVCLNCGKQFLKKACELKKRSNSFCNRSCAATYNNKHKTRGTRRSKLEVFIEENLKILYPSLKFDFNQKDAIDSELDIFIPSLKLAFELNGIFHYEPIYGGKKLMQIQNNDNRKFQACLERNIELCIIDTSSLSYFKPANAKKYLDIICNIIEQKNGTSTRTRTGKLKSSRV